MSVIGGSTVYTYYVHMDKHLHTCKLTCIQLPMQVLLPPGGLTPRWAHAGGVIYITATLRLVIIVGGVSDNHTKYDSADDWPLLSDTTVLELGEWSTL